MIVYTCIEVIQSDSLLWYIELHEVRVKLFTSPLHQFIVDSLAREESSKLRVASTCKISYASV